MKRAPQTLKMGSPREAKAVSERNRKTLRLGAAVLGIAGLAAAGAFLAAEAPTGNLVSPYGQSGRNVEVEQLDAMVVCPPAVIDPASQLERKDAFASSDLHEKLAAAGTYSAGEPGFVVTADTGDLQGVLVDACETPSRHAVLLPASTAVGEQASLTLANPAPKPVQAEVQVNGPVGPMLERPMQVLVPAASSVTVLPALAAGGEQNIAVTVSSDGQGVAAWLQTSGLDGEVQQGMTRIKAQEPAEVLLIPAAQSDRSGRLVLFNPDSQVASADVQVMDEDGTKDLGGAQDISVPAGGLASVSLEGLPEGTEAVRVESRVPLAAAVSLTLVGAEHPLVDDQKMVARAVLTPSSPTATSVLPKGDVLTEAADYVDGKVQSTNLYVANPNAGAVTVAVGAETLRVPGNAAARMSVSLTDAQNVAVEASDPVAMTFEAQIETSFGPVLATTGLTSSEASLDVLRVSVFPLGPNRTGSQ